MSVALAGKESEIELLISALIFILIAGVVYYFAQQFLPHPFPTVVLVIGVIFLLVWLLGAADGADLNFGQDKGDR